MFKRLSIVALLTGCSQLIALAAIGFATRIFDASTIGRIGTIESSALLIISIVSFGLQLATNRDILINKNWSLYFEQGQKARVTMSVILFPAGCLYWFTGDIAYLLFFISPIIALNGDYALYGCGFSEYASGISLFRVLIPSTTLIICSMVHSQQIVSFYAVGMISGIFMAGYLSSLKLNTRYWFFPKLQSLKYYFDSFKLGIGSVSLTIMGSGLILISNHFYELNEVGEAYLGIKLFIIYKGVRRIIIQAFFSDLKEPSNALMVDRLNIVIGIFGGALFIFYPTFVINIFYGEASIGLNSVIQLVGIAILLSSLTSVAETIIMLNKMDLAYCITNISSMLISVLSVIVSSIILPKSVGILVGVVIGEVSFFFFLAHFLGYSDFFLKRIEIFLGNAFVFIVPPVCISLVEDRVLKIVLPLFIMFILLGVINKNIITWKKS
ncbi:hypothetical protein [uncultured Desulfobacter sp.]|uniref:hypothetical protein n=1 Tax=uncultured Desulfobacter sp. TaxID=240139 RepID=UPI00259B9886|nr:hypothetical protein [uncultured Desulfobacter sp.]